MWSDDARPNPKSEARVAVWWKADPQELHRIVDRVSSLYVERVHVDRDDNAVVFINKERTVRVPAAMVAVLLLGPGTRITHGAVNLLGDSGTAICWVGEHGVRMYAGGLGASRGTRLLQRQAYLVSRTAERLGVARTMYSMRFPGEDVSKLTMQQLRGREGVRVRRIYKQEAERTGVKWTRREYRHGDPQGAGDDINRLLSAGHACLYGICHAVIVGIGVSPGLGFVHTGSAVSFVLDVADLYKAEFTIPLAFDLAARGRSDERDMRLAFRDRLVDGKLMQRIIHDIQSLLADSTPEHGSGVSEDAERSELWAGASGTVPSGVNWGAFGVSDDLQFGDHAVVTGPDVTTEVPQ